MNTRKELVATLFELSEHMPEVRFGQLVTNLSFAAQGPNTDSTWEVEDKALMIAAQKQLAALRQANAPHSPPTRRQTK